MSKCLRTLSGLGLVLLVAALTTSIHAKDEDDAKNGENKGEKRVSAATIDYGAELGLPFSSLNTLGVRIETARREADPVGLISAANELRVAEQVAGKQNEKLSSSQLAKEAFELAKMRFRSIELRAVATALSNDKQSKELLQLAEEAADVEKEALAAAEDGERPKGIYGELIFNNHSHEHVHVYYNGREIGHADPHQHKHFHIHDHAHLHYFDLKAVGHHHTWRRHVHGDFSRYTWTIH